LKEIRGKLLAHAGIGAAPAAAAAASATPAPAVRKVA